ncbi:MAG: phosphoenolpyruvate carboxykinase domain-containing protein, partial [Deltaproteobacteria bacterium]|nr:phosphoenolpyruvate carboxykinase domain-containing protein [Deltaproteobacteria bacterium]
GDNIRVLKWIIDRLHNRVGARETPLGVVPHVKDLDISGLTIPEGKVRALFEVEPEGWQQEVRDIGVFLDQFGPRLPSEIREEYGKFAEALK